MVIFIVIFYLLCSLISFAMIYSAEIVDIASEDVERYNPSISELDEKDRIHTYKVDTYIENTICPRYYHQILKREIEYYQDKHSEHYYLSVATIHLFLFMIPTRLFIKAKYIESFALSCLISAIIGIVCYYIAKLIYKKYWRCSNIRIRNYYELYSSYDWHKHYYYLSSIKQSVIFRYSLRKIFEFLSLWIYLLFFFRVPD